MENQFLERLLANPNDLASWAVYADYLLQRNDPRGELLALELAHKTDEVSELRARLVRDWFGSVEVDLAYEEYAYAEDWDWSKPVPTQSKHVQDLGSSYCTMTWWGPFVQELRLKQGKPPEYDDSGYSYQVYDRPKARDVWPLLLGSPACRLLQSLHVEVGEENDWDILVDLLPESLRALHLGSDDPEWVSPDQLPDLSQLFLKCPRIEDLSLQGRAYQLSLESPVPAPRLTSLKIRATNLKASQLSDLTPQRFPMLEHLSVESLYDDYWEQRILYRPNDADAQRWLAEHRQNQEDLLLFLRQDFPQVRELKIDGMGRGLSTLQALQASPMLPRLRWLEVGGCTLESNLQAVLKFRTQWHHIQHIGLEINEKERYLQQLQPYTALQKAFFK